MWICTQRLDLEILAYAQLNLTYVNQTYEHQKYAYSSYQNASLNQNYEKKVIKNKIKIEDPH